MGYMDITRVSGPVCCHWKAFSKPMPRGGVRTVALEREPAGQRANRLVMTVQAPSDGRRSGRPTTLRPRNGSLFVTQRLVERYGPDMERGWPQVLWRPLRSPEGGLCHWVTRCRLGPTKDPYVRYCGVGVRLQGWLPGQLLDLAVPPPAKHHVLSITITAGSVLDDGAFHPRPVRVLQM
jgi:hypothetical protein